MVETITIYRDTPIEPKKDYFQFHHFPDKKLISKLKPHERRGIDVIFLYYQTNNMSLFKKVDRFWHNFRKTVDKDTYYCVKNRTTQVFVSDCAEAQVWMNYFSNLDKQPMDLWSLRTLDN